MSGTVHPTAKIVVPEESLGLIDEITKELKERGIKCGLWRPIAGRNSKGCEIVCPKDEIIELNNYLSNLPSPVRIEDPPMVPF